MAYPVFSQAYAYPHQYMQHVRAHVQFSDAHSHHHHQVVAHPTGSSSTSSSSSSDGSDHHSHRSGTQLVEYPDRFVLKLHLPSDVDIHKIKIQVAKDMKTLSIVMSKKDAVYAKYLTPHCILSRRAPSWADWTEEDVNTTMTHYIHLLRRVNPSAIKATVDSGCLIAELPKVTRHVKFLC